MERKVLELGTARGGGLLQRFQTELERLRRQTGLSRCAYADRLGIPRSTYFRLTSPDGNPSLGTVELIAQLVGVEPLALLSRRNQAEDAPSPSPASIRGS
jgi:transcriptional regulator with XRE-family HTH domain